MRKIILAIVATLITIVLRADIKVSDVEVFSGYPWKEVVIGYTISGTEPEAGAVQVTVTDKAANKTYVVVSGSSSLTGVSLSEGRHVMRWAAASDGVRFSSDKVVFEVSVLCDGVQLWENGPYWSERNVGATKPEEYGYYFWWGDTVGYKRNAENNGWVSVSNGSSFSFSSRNCPTSGKSNSELQSLGYIDSTGNLTASHDAATAHLGAPWRMPTHDEFMALIDNCDSLWTTMSGVNGRLFRGRGEYAARSIFIPASGGLSGSGSVSGLGTYGECWSSTPYSGNNNCAWRIVISSSKIYMNGDGGNRYYGQNIRPVRGFSK